jgi:hypothetical protein
MATYTQVLEFNSQLKSYILESGQLNLDDSMVRLYSGYEIELRRLFRDLKECQKNEKECIEQFKNAFEKLRSDTSKTINKN